MNKEELKELAATLNGIADGKAWEYLSTGDGDDFWTDPGSLDIGFCLFNCSGVRLKPWSLPPPQPDPYAELKAAHAAGRQIQRKWSTVKQWHDADDADWTLPPESYRIKPEQQKVPLGPSDVPPGTVLRGAGEAATPEHQGWCMITSSSLTGIRIWRHSDSSQTEIKWEILMDTGSEIWRPTDTEWQPCYKLIDTP